MDAGLELKQVEALIKAVAEIGLCPALLVYLLYRMDWRMRQLEEKMNDLRYSVSNPRGNHRS